MLHARQPSIQHIRLVASRVPERVPHNWPSSLRLLCTAAIICGQWDHLLSVSLSVHRLVCARVRVRSAYTSVAALGTMARNSRDLLVVLFEAPSSEIEDRGRSPSGHVAATRCKYSVATAARAARDQHARQPLVLGGLVQYPKAAETARCGCTSASCCELARLLRAVAARGQRPCYRARAAAATARDQGGMYAEPFATGADRIAPAPFCRQRIAFSCHRGLTNITASPLQLALHDRFCARCTHIRCIYLGTNAVTIEPTHAQILIGAAGRRATQAFTFDRVRPDSPRSISLALLARGPRACLPSHRSL